MEYTIFLAKVFGVFFVSACALFSFREREVRSIVRSMIRERALIFVTALASLSIGLILVFSHSVFTSVVASVITLTGWLIALKAVALLYMKESQFEKTVNLFNKTYYIRSYTVLVGVVGVFLLMCGFGVVWF